MLATPIAHAQSLTPVHCNRRAYWRAGASRATGKLPIRESVDSLCRDIYRHDTPIFSYRMAQNSSYKPHTRTYTSVTLLARGVTRIIGAMGRRRGRLLVSRPRMRMNRYFCLYLDSLLVDLSNSGVTLVQSMDRGWMSLSWCFVHYKEAE